MIKNFKHWGGYQKYVPGDVVVPKRMCPRIGFLVTLFPGSRYIVIGYGWKGWDGIIENQEPEYELVNLDNPREGSTRIGKKQAEEYTILSERVFKNLSSWVCHKFCKTGNLSGCTDCPLNGKYPEASQYFFLGDRVVVKSESSPGMLFPGYISRVSLGFLEYGLTRNTIEEIERLSELYYRGESIGRDEILGITYNIAYESSFKYIGTGKKLNFSGSISGESERIRLNTRRGYTMDRPSSSDNDPCSVCIFSDCSECDYKKSKEYKEYNNLKNESYDSY